MREATKKTPENRNTVNKTSAEVAPQPEPPIRNSSILSGLDTQVFTAVSQARTGISRADLIKVTELPRSTVNSSVRKLIELGDIEEYKMAGSTGGRRAALLRAVPKRDLVFVAELGTKHARVGLADISGRIIAAINLKTDIGAAQTETLNLLTTTWDELKKIHIPNRSIAAVAIAVPGPVDSFGLVTGAARMPGWNQTDLKSMLSEKLGLPVFVENDARAGAIGEWAIRGMQADATLYIKAGSGIGAAWIADGVVYRGSNGFAGEITHTRIETNNPLPCSCGNTGCLETVGSGAAIMRKLSTTELEINSVSQLIHAAQNGDYTVVPLVREAGRRIGEVLSGLVNFLNPRQVIIGGSLSQIDALIAGIRTELYRRCLPMSTSELTVETSISRQDAPLIGMAFVTRERLFYNT